jgi:hypothetical protein
MSKQLRTAALAAAAILGTAGSAAAEGYIEGVVGAVVPLEEDDYADAVDEGLKLGLRAGSGLGPGAFELAADYTAFGGFEVLGSTYDFTRYRVLAGGRHRIGLDGAGKVALLLRVGVGVDVMSLHVTNDLFDFEQTETDAGIAAEVGTGFLVSLGKVYVGGQLALPMAFHFDEDDPDDPEDNDVEYNAIDIDVLFTVGARI